MIERLPSQVLTITYNFKTLRGTLRFFMEGKDLISWRKKWGLTQRELAQSLGVDVMTISRWERGTRGIPALLPLALEALENRIKEVK